MEKEFVFCKLRASNAMGQSGFPPLLTATFAAPSHHFFSPFLEKNDMLGEP